MSALGGHYIEIVIMTSRFPSSRQQFEQYKHEFHSVNGRGAGGKSKPRERSAWMLIQNFLRLLHGHRLSMALSLTTLTVATILALIPPAATKFVVDYVLGGKTASRIRSLLGSS